METTFRHVLLATDLASTASRARSVAVELAERARRDAHLVCDRARAVSAAVGEVTAAASPPGLGEAS